MNAPVPSPRSLDRFLDRLSELMPRFMQAALLEERTLLSSGLVTLPQLWALAHLDRGGLKSSRSPCRRVGRLACIEAGCDMHMGECRCIPCMRA